MMNKKIINGIFITIAACLLAQSLLPLNVIAKPKSDLKTYQFNEGKAFLNTDKNIIPQLSVFETGHFVSTKQFLSEESSKLEVYQADLDGDGEKEVIVLPQKEEFGSVGYYKPTILKKSGDKYKVVYVSHIPVMDMGDRLTNVDMYELTDIRDLNNDNRAEIILSSHAGVSTYQDQNEIIYFDGKEYKSQTFPEIPNFMELKDFGKDGKYELIVTYPYPGEDNEKVCHACWSHWSDVYVWNGKKFIRDNYKYPDFYEYEVIPGYKEDISDLRKNQSSYIEENKIEIKARLKLIKKAKKILKKSASK